MKVQSAALRAALVSLIGLAAGKAHAICTFGSGSGEPSLQGTFDSLLGAGTLNSVTACVNDGSDAAWETVGRSAEIDIAVELAGNARVNEFGIYNLEDPTERVTVFEGLDGAGSTAIIRLRTDGDGLWRVGVQENNGSAGDSNSWTWLRQMGTTAFGFYLSSTTEGTFYSETALNTDGLDHMYAYQGNGAQFISGTRTGETFGPNDYIIAWEDLRGGGDGDYQDFVANLQRITPVPLPPAVLMLLSGLVALVGVSRRNHGMSAQ